MGHLSSEMAKRGFDHFYPFMVDNCTDLQTPVQSVTKGGCRPILLKKSDFSHWKISKLIISLEPSPRCVAFRFCVGRCSLVSRLIEGFC